MQPFFLRRAIERLRDGLFDSAALNQLTIKPEAVVKSFFKGLSAIEKGQPAHLCICGSYGQGKSHTLNYLQQETLAQGYATSLVQIDVRQVPFYQFPVVYHSLMEGLKLPDGLTLVEAWNKFGSEESLNLPVEMPYRFKMVFRAMIAEEMSSKEQPASQKRVVKLPFLHRKDVSDSLEMALMGRDIPLSALKQAIRSRAVQEQKKELGQQKESLLCKGNFSYVQMMQALACLLKKMGYKGLVLFFDEAEAIAQGRASCRAKSYEILQHLFTSQTPLYPIFAFTESFFDRVHSEEYEGEPQLFAANYAKEWEAVNVQRLKEASAKEWEALIDRLIDLYAQAYKIDLSDHFASIKKKLQLLLLKLQPQEMRLKLKMLVNQLDIETQNYFLSAVDSL